MLTPFRKLYAITEVPYMSVALPENGTAKVTVVLVVVDTTSAPTC
jgi:hypothetical protein